MWIKTYPKEVGGLYGRNRALYAGLGQYGDALQIVLSAKRIVEG